MEYARLCDPDKYQKSADSKDERQFWRDFSRVYVEKADGVVYLVMPHDVKPREDSIFYSVELDILIGDEGVDQIFWIDPKDLDTIMSADNQAGDGLTTYWTRGEPKPTPEAKDKMCVFNFCVNPASPERNIYYWESL